MLKKCHVKASILSGMNLSGGFMCGWQTICVHSDLTANYEVSSPDLIWHVLYLGHQYVNQIAMRYVAKILVLTQILAPIVYHVMRNSALQLIDFQRKRACMQMIANVDSVKCFSF